MINASKYMLLFGVISPLFFCLFVTTYSSVIGVFLSHHFISSRKYMSVCFVGLSKGKENLCVYFFILNLLLDTPPLPPQHEKGKHLADMNAGPHWHWQACKCKVTFKYYITPFQGAPPPPSSPKQYLIYGHTGKL